MRAPLVPVIAITLVTVACGGVKVQPQPGADLGDRLTYSWAPDTALNPRLGTRERLRQLDQTLRQAVDEELMWRGYQQVASGGTDMIVTYRLLLEDKSPRSLRDYADYRSEGGTLSAGKALGGYTEGTLIVELIDGRTRQSLWRSSATAIPDAKGQGERLPRVVQEMMAPLPTRR